MINLYNIEKEADEKKYLQEGEQWLKIVDVETKTSASGNKMIVVKLENESGVGLTDYLVNTPKARFKFSQYSKGIGFQILDQEITIENFAHQILNKEVFCDVGVKEEEWNNNGTLKTIKKPFIKFIKSNENEEKIDFKIFTNSVAESDLPF